MDLDKTQSPFSLRGHSALVTGSTQGVGAAIAIALARAGANVCLHGLQHDAQCDVVMELCRVSDVQVQCITADLTDTDDAAIDRFITAVNDKMPRIDLLVNNAGMYNDLPFLEMTRQRYARTMQLNVEAGFFITQRFARRWVTESVQGRILFTGSINGLLAEPTHVAYDASKGAVAAMVRSLCVSLAPYRIRVNAIAPGLVRTPLTNAVLSTDEDVLQWMRLHTPNGEVPGAEVCGGAAVFLLSDAAAHVHGQTLMIDGGMSAWQQPDLPEKLRGRF